MIDDNIYLVFGKESIGLNKELLKKNKDKCFRIPISSNLRALNLSNAVAIVVYEILRQNKFVGLSLNEPHKLNYLEDVWKKNCSLFFALLY